MQDFLLGTLESSVRIAISALIIYIAVVIFIRLSGKRSTSQMNNFDWIVTVAMGSIVASGILMRDVAVADALLAIGFILLFQYAITRGILHSDVLASLVKSEPRLLCRDGEFLVEAMRAERVTRAEILAAVRSSGIHDLDRVAAVVLETDATFSVLQRPDRSEESETLHSVRGWNSTGPCIKIDPAD